jgi:hypothetical protein
VCVVVIVSPVLLEATAGIERRSSNAGANRWPAGARSGGFEGCTGSLKANLSLLLRQLKNLDEVLAAYSEEVEALAVAPRYQAPVVNRPFA